MEVSLLQPNDLPWLLGIGPSFSLYRPTTQYIYTHNKQAKNCPAEVLKLQAKDNDLGRSNSFWIVIPTLDGSHNQFCLVQDRVVMHAKVIAKPGTNRLHGNWKMARVS